MDKSLKEEVLERLDIVEVVGERISLRRRGREFLGLCPFHDDHKPSLSVSPDKQIFKCWSCGAGGDLLKFVQMYERLDFRETLSLLAQRAGLDQRVSSGSSGAPPGERQELQRVMAWARGHFQRNLAADRGRAARDYARRRGLSDETVEAFGLGFAVDAWNDLENAARKAGIGTDLLVNAGLVARNDRGQTYDRFRNRLIFPIQDPFGRTVAFGGRTLGDDPAKYLNSPESPLFSKSRVLYGLDLARGAIRDSREAIVVEGYMDAVLLAQHRVPNVVATLGTALTAAHAGALVPLADAVVMCFDGDEAGAQAADRACEVTLRHPLEVRVALLEGEDPAERVIRTGADGFRELLQSARPALEFKWARTQKAIIANGLRGKREAVEAFLRFVASVVDAGVSDPIEQGMLVGRVADVLALPARDVYDALARIRGAAQRRVSAETPDISGNSSAYDASVRGLPPGLVSAVEELLGLAMMTPRWNAALENALAASVPHCRWWQGLYRQIEDRRQRELACGLSEVLAESSEEALCDLGIRAARRVSQADASPEVCEAVSARVIEELALLRRRHLGEKLRGSGLEDGEAAFRTLLDVARRHNGVLGAAHRSG